MYLVNNYIPIYLKNAIDLNQYFSFESVHCEAILKMGWVVKKWNSSFLDGNKLVKMQSDGKLILSIYTNMLSIYTNNKILCII